MSDPICTEKGCICGWCRGLTDDEFEIIYMCVAREVARRLGMSWHQIQEIGKNSFDPALVKFQADCAERFGGKGKKDA